MKIFSHRHTIRHITILTMLILFLTTCSSTRFIYTFIDEIIKDEVNYFLDLDEEEKVFLNQQVSAMVNWHRTSMLPKYASYLNNIADKLEDDQYTPADINKYLANGRSLIEETMVKNARSIIDLARASGKELIFPVDLICSQSLSGSPIDNAVDARQISNDIMGLDIGPKSIRLFNQILDSI